MAIQMGEYLVGAYLKLILGCEVVDYNLRFPGGGRVGQFELDVLGLNFKTKTAYICEVSTHLDGLLYGNSNKDTFETVIAKHQRQINYANEFLQGFSNHHFMLWAPRVPVGFLTTEFSKIPTLELIINKEYSRAIDKLRNFANQNIKETGNPAFRILQILENLRN
jgi:hypothetical protein